MKKLIVASIFSVFLLGLMSNASAFWGSNNSNECYGPYGKIPGCNEYDEWDPRYWMEEMEDMWDDDDEGYGRGGYGYGMPPMQMPYGGGYGMPPMQMPYGYQQPYAAPAPAPAAPAK